MSYYYVITDTFSNLLLKVEELRSRLAGAEKVDEPEPPPATKRNSLLSNGVIGSPPALPEKPRNHIRVQKDEIKESVPSTGVIVGSQLSLWTVSQVIMPI